MKLSRVNGTKVIKLAGFECNLAKRIKIKKIVLTHKSESVECIPYPRGTQQELEGNKDGALAEWLCSGLQIRGPRFDSGRRLHLSLERMRH